MQTAARGGGFIQLAVAWEGEPPDEGDRTFELASAYAAVLARTLESAGFQPRRLEVVIRPRAGGAFALHVYGDVQGMPDEAFASLARVTLTSPRLAETFNRDGDNHRAAHADLELVTELISSSNVSTQQQVVAHAESVPKHSRLPVGRIVTGLALGLLLGVLGLPRLDIAPLLSRLPAAQPTPLPLPPIVVAPEPRTPLHEVEPTFVPPTRVPVNTPTSEPAPTATSSGPRVLFAQRFVAPLPGWPHDVAGNAWFADGAYRLLAREPGRFVAVGVPLSRAVADATLTAQFRKVGGPTGGGYGFIVRDQGMAAERDSRNQAGRYLVVEVGDKGDVGVWQREQNRWIDIAPWSRSTSVNTGIQPNMLTLTLRGPALHLEVNGDPVADLTYTALPVSGGVGIFVGGDLNEVALEWLRIESA